VFRLGQPGSCSRQHTPSAAAAAAKPPRLLVLGGRESAAARARLLKLCSLSLLGVAWRPPKHKRLHAQSTRGHHHHCPATARQGKNVSFTACVARSGLQVSLHQFGRARIRKQSNQKQRGDGLALARVPWTDTQSGEVGPTIRSGWTRKKMSVKKEKEIQSAAVHVVWCQWTWGL